jgi:hypothetical protein
MDKKREHLIFVKGVRACPDRQFGLNQRVSPERAA